MIKTIDATDGNQRPRIGSKWQLGNPYGCPYLFKPEYRDGEWRRSERLNRQRVNQEAGGDSVHHRRRKPDSDLTKVVLEWGDNILSEYKHL